MTDADGGDFRLKPDAPLFRRIRDFRPIYMDRIGIRP